MPIVKTTIRGYPADLCISTIQKAIRRGDFITAGFFALEIFHSGWYKWVWKRLLTISAEDIADFVTAEIEALYNSFMLVNQGHKVKSHGRVFIIKAVWVLAHANKSRDTDHLLHFIYDREEDNNNVTTYIDKMNNVEIPEYAYDCHTRAGRAMGKTKEEFFKTEKEALTPRRDDLEDFIQ